MKKYLFNISILLALVIGACAPTKQVKEITTSDTKPVEKKVSTKSPEVIVQAELPPLLPADTSNSNSLLWEIAGNEFQQPSYLYGTIHIIPVKDFIMSDLVKNRFAQTQQLTLEIDMDNPMAIFGALTGMFMDDGMTLHDLLSEEDYNRLDKHFEEELGLGNLGMFKRMKPMLLSMMMTEEEANVEEVTSYEQEFMAMAKKKKMPVKGLETAAYQMSMLDSIPYDDQAQMLIDALDQKDNGVDMFATMVDLYKAQDLDGLQKMVAEESEGTENFDTALLDTRNQNWIPVMTKMGNKRPTFFAVGAAHLPGEKGVIELLRKEGYKLTPLREIKE